MQESMLQIVEFRAIPGFDGYEASSDGHIWSNKYREKRRLSPGTKRNGYKHVNLSMGNKAKCYYVHRLVLLAFVGPPANSGMQACHGPDPDKGNNALCNLRWGTPLENTREKAAQGKQPYGAAAGGAKLTEEIVRKIRKMSKDGKHQKDIAALYGIQQSTVSKIVLRTRWKHLGD